MPLQIAVLSGRPCKRAAVDCRPAINNAGVVANQAATHLHRPAAHASASSFSISPQLMMPASVDLPKTQEFVRTTSSFATSTCLSGQPERRPTARRESGI